MKKTGTLIILVLGLVCWGLGTSAQDVWTGGGSAPLNWSDAANWVGAAPANDGTGVVQFNADQGLNPVVDAAWNVQQIQFLDDLGNFTLSGETITLTPTVWSDGIRVANNVTTSQQIIQNNIVLGAHASVQASTVGPTPVGQLLQLTGNINLGAFDLYYQGGGHSNGGSGVVELAGIISGTGQIRIAATTSRPQIMRLLGNNDFSGGVNLARTDGGAIQVGHDQALGTGTLTSAGYHAHSSFTLEAYGGIRTLANNFTIETGQFGSDEAKPWAFKGDFVLNGNVTMTSRNGHTWRPFAVTSGTTELNGDILQTTTDMEFHLQGDGTMIVNGDLTHKGATFVGLAAGGESTKLFVNGLITDSPLVTVRSAATLGGTGTVNAVTVASAGILHPGNSAGTLNVAGMVTLEAADSVFQVDLEGNDVSGRLAITGGYLDLSSNGGTLSLMGTPGSSTLYTLATFDTTDPATYGTFSTVLLNGDAQAFTDSGYEVLYGSDSITLAIPEPGTLALLLLAGGALLLRRRRR